MKIALTIVLLLAADVASAATCSWTGHNSFKWSEPLNWASCESRAPRSGDALVFPFGADEYTSENDIAGLSLTSITVSSARYQILGLGILLQALTYNGKTSLNHNTASFTIPITLSAPLLLANTSTDRTSIATGDINLNGFALSLTVTDGLTFLTLGGVISGHGSLYALTQGQFIISGHNTYTGPTTGIAATLRPAQLDGLGASGFGNYTTLRDGAQLWLPTASPGATFDESMTFETTGGELDGSNVTLTGTMTFTSSQMRVVGSGLIFNGPLNGDALSVQGTLAGPNTFNNPANVWASTTIKQATAVNIGAPGAWPATPIDNDGRLDLNGVDTVIGPLTGCGEVHLGAATLTLTGKQPASASYAGIFTGTGNLVKVGLHSQTLTNPVGCAAPPLVSFPGTTTVTAGRLILANASSSPLSGTIIVNGGSLEQSLDNQIGDAAAVTIKAGGTWLLNDHSETIGSLAGDGSVLVGRGTITTGGNGASTTFGGVISSVGASPDQTTLVKAGGGTLTLAGKNTYTGKTLINAGTVIVNGGTSAAATMAIAGGTLGGTGTVGAISATGGAVSPGSSPGVLHAAGLALTAPAAFNVELSGLTAGTGYDQLDLTGDATLNNPTLIVTRTFAPRLGATFTILHVASGHTLTGTFNGLPEGATLDLQGQRYIITYHGGGANDVVLTALDDVPVTYYLSEGATGAFFDEDVLIANPNATDAPVTLTFSKEDGSQVTSTQTIPAQSRVTVHVDTIPGLEKTAASTQVRSEHGVPLVVERTMFWDQSHYAGSTGSAVDQPAQDWFFAEGSQGFFSTFVLVINPNATPTDVTFTFLRESDTPVTKIITVGANTRLTLDAGTVPEIANRSFGITVHGTQPIMAERSMYFGTTPTRLWSGGTESAGVTALSTHWFLAEGATGGFFDTFILLSNPNVTPANVTLQYLLDTGDTVSVPKVVPGNARLTTNIETESDARLHNAAVSTVVTSDQPIIAERSMYWPGAAVPWGEGHNSFGVVDAGLHWGLAEGRTGGPFNFHTYILLANPQVNAANVTVTFLRESGAAPVTKTFTVPPTSRFNIDAGTITELSNESFGADIHVTNNVPIIVERSMYWDSNGFQFSGGTNATGSRLP